MSSVTDSFPGFGRSSGMDDEGGIDTTALAGAVRDSVASVAFALVMLVLTVVELFTSVYTSATFAAFFGICTLAGVVLAAWQLRSNYAERRFERTYDY